jgi:hypothetical protein
MSLTRPLENFLIYRRDLNLEKQLKIAKISYGVMEQLYGSIRDLHEYEE